MSTISNTLGVGSGIDTQSLIKSLVAAQTEPKEALLKARETRNGARISTLGSITSSIDTFSSSLNTLIAGGTLFTQPTTSDAGIVAVAAVAGTRLGTLSSELEVRQLAQPQALTSVALARAADPVGQGMLTIKVGAKAIDVAIGPDDDSLAGLARAINGAGAGLNASVVTGTNGAQLVVRGQSGAANAFTIELKSGDPAALGRFAFGGTSDPAGMTRSKEAVDAMLVLDGIPTTRPTNSIEDLIPGARIDLNKAAEGTVVRIGSTRPTASIQSALTDFVAAYNELAKQLADATAAPSGATEAGALRGDRGIADARRQLAKLTSTELTGAGNGPRTLAEIGVSTNRDGTLSLDTTRLSAQLAANPDAVEGMFNPSQTTSSPFVAITSKYGATKPGTYVLANVTAATADAAAGGLVAGFLGIGGADGSLSASAFSPAKGLTIRASANVAAVTVTIEPGLGGALQAIRDALRGTTGALTLNGTGFKAETDAIAAERTKIAGRATAYEAQLTTSYARMETRVAAYKATQSYLEQQVAIWTKSDS